MRVIVVGLGVQGHKRRRIAGADVVAAVDPVTADARYRRDRGRAARRTTTRCWSAPRTSPRSTLLTYCLDNGKHVLVEKPLVGDTRSGDRRPRDARARATASSATPPTITASSRTSCACATSSLGRARRDLSLPDVLRQRHGAAGARFRLARPGRRRAARSRLASARHLPLLVRRHRATSSSVVGATASRTARPITSSSAARSGSRRSSWR